jgi:hypothetical protein
MSWSASAGEVKDNFIDGWEIKIEFGYEANDKYGAKKAFFRERGSTGELFDIIQINVK